MKDLVAMKPPPSILVVEDDYLIRELLIDTLGDTGAVVMAVATAEQGLALVEERCWTLLLTDIETPGSIDGLELAWLTNEKYPDTAIIVTSGGHDAVARRSLPEGAQFLAKPWVLKDLMAAVGGQLSKNCRCQQHAE